MTALEIDRKHVEMMVDADDEIKAARKAASKTIDSLRMVSMLYRLARHR